MATREQKNATDLSEQAIALAEQLGRIAGTIEGTAESWMNRQTLTDAAHARARQRHPDARGADGRHGKEAESGEEESPSRAAFARQADPAHAPGKRRRKPAPTMKGVKKSDQRIPKMRTAAEARQRQEDPTCEYG